MHFASFFQFLSYIALKNGLKNRGISRFDARIAGIANQPLKKKRVYVELEHVEVDEPKDPRRSLTPELEGLGQKHFKPSYEPNSALNLALADGEQNWLTSRSTSVSTVNDSGNDSTQDLEIMSSQNESIEVPSISSPKPDVYVDQSTFPVEPSVSPIPQFAERKDSKVSNRIFNAQQLVP